MPGRTVAPQTLKAIEKLRNATRSRHANLESIPAMSRLFAVDYTVSEYQSHLGRMLGLIEPLERAASLAAEAGQPVPVPLRSTDLRSDLIAMGTTQVEIDSFERCLHIPSLSVPGLPGLTYVVLGSTFGGRVIAKQLLKVLGSRGSYCFYGNGQQKWEAQWACFRSDLEKTGEQDVEAICATAVEVFDLYARWLADPLPDARVHA